MLEVQRILQDCMSELTSKALLTPRLYVFSALSFSCCTSLRALQSITFKILLDSHNKVLLRCHSAERPAPFALLNRSAKEKAHGSTRIDQAIAGRVLDSNLGLIR